MKRTELKRSRKPLRKRSVKNSQPHRSQSVVSEYRDSHPTCLLCGNDAQHIHHIFGGAGMRIDTPANLAALCVRCHADCHTWPVNGKLDCLWRKLRRNEFNAVELDAMGGERIAGWLARNKPAGGALLAMWAQLVDVCEVPGC